MSEEYSATVDPDAIISKHAPLSVMLGCVMMLTIRLKNESRADVDKEFMVGTMWKAMGEIAHLILGSPADRQWFGEIIPKLNEQFDGHGVSINIEDLDPIFPEEH